jgi:hypothetical protein
MEEPNAYEAARLRRIAENQEKLAALGIRHAAASLGGGGGGGAPVAGAAAAAAACAALCPARAAHVSGTAVLCACACGGAHPAPCARRRG